MFWNKFSVWGEKPALVLGQTSVNYLQLAQLCDQFSELLPKRKSLVLINLDNSIESIAALYGTLRAGHAALFCDSNNAELFKNLKETYSPDYLYTKQADVWTLKNTDIKRNYNLHEDLALVISTSGSTGVAKCVRLSKLNVSSNTKSIVEYLNLSSADSAALLLPIHYCYGLSVLNTHLSVGASVHVGELNVLHEDFIDYLKTQRITGFAGVPYTFELLDRKNFQSEYLPDLRYVTQAGGKLSQTLVKKFVHWSNTQNKEFFVMYGQSEATARIAYMPPDMLEKFPDCIGIPIPGGSLSIQDEFGNNIDSIDTPGELVYQGPNVMMGYATTALDLAKGSEVVQLNTGDLACINEHGLFYIVGRLKRFAKLFGKRYNLDEIEKFIHNIDHTAVCVSNDKKLFIGSENEEMGEVVKAVSQQFKIPSISINTLSFTSKPVLPSGKIDYQEILRLFTTFQNNANKSDVKNASNQKNKINSLINAYAIAFPGINIKEDDSFSSLRGDSLTYVSVSIGIENIVGALPLKWENKTIKELSSLPDNLYSANTSSVETGVVVRVYAILAIVSGHAGIESVFGGAALLLLLAGMNFSRFHFNNLLDSKPLSLFSSVFKNILIPYWLILTVANIYHQDFYIDTAEFLLTANFYPEIEDNAPFFTWFIQTLIHSIVLVSIPLLFSSVRTWAKNNSLRYAIYMFAFASFLRAIDGHFGVGLDLGAVDQRTAWSFWIFCFGLIVSLIKTQQEKLICTAIAIVWALTFFSGDYPRILTISIGVTLIIWMENISIYKPLVPAIKLIGSASIFIYLVHLTGLVAYLPITDDIYSTALRIFVGLVQGIVLWKAYSYTETLLISIFRRKKVVDI